MSGEITRYQPGNVDIHRQGGRTGGDAGSGSGGHGEVVESAAVERLKDQISEITKLAHTGRDRDERAYRARQGELQSLMRQLVAARGGQAVATVGDNAPSDPSSYPNLPVDSVYREAWSDAKDQLAQAGITVEQSRILGQAVLRAEQEGQERAAAAVQQRREDTKRSLARLYGSGWEREVAAGNQKARELLPGGAARELFAERLADGSILGDHEMIARLLIELARQ
jgi:hypothetical protein